MKITLVDSAIASASEARATSHAKPTEPRMAEGFSRRRRAYVRFNVQLAALPVARPSHPSRHFSTRPLSTL
jgi:hypothetical protein